MVLLGAMVPHLPRSRRAGEHRRDTGGGGGQWPRGTDLEHALGNLWVARWSVVRLWVGVGWLFFLLVGWWLAGGCARKETERRQVMGGATGRHDICERRLGF